MRASPRYLGCRDPRWHTGIGVLSRSQPSRSSSRRAVRSRVSRIGRPRFHEQHPPIGGARRACHRILNSSASTQAVQSSLTVIDAKRIARAASVTGRIGKCASGIARLGGQVSGLASSAKNRCAEHAWLKQAGTNRRQTSTTSGSTTATSVCFGRGRTSRPSAIPTTAGRRRWVSETVAV